MALSKYEIVVLFDASNSQENIENGKKEVETLIEQAWGKILDRDDIAYLETLYDIWTSSNPYFYSLLVEMDWKNNKELKRKIWIVKSVVRNKVLRMEPNQKFLKFKEIEKELKNIDFSDLYKSWIFNEIKS